METKKVREWFEQTLPKEIAEKAIENTITLNSNPKTLYDKEESFRYSLATSFMWSETPEGHEYWSKIYDKYEN